MVTRSVCPRSTAVFLVYTFILTRVRPSVAFFVTHHTPTRHIQRPEAGARPSRRRRGFKGWVGSSGMTSRAEQFSCGRAADLTKAAPVRLRCQTRPWRSVKDARRAFSWSHLRRSAAVVSLAHFPPVLPSTLIRFRERCGRRRTTLFLLRRVYIQFFHDSPVQLES